MKPEYIEGREAAENFEQGMKALFKVPKVEVVKAEKKAARRPSRKKQKKSHKD